MNGGSLREEGLGLGESLKARPFSKRNSPILFRVETQGQAKVVSVAEKSTFVVPP